MGRLELTPEHTDLSVRVGGSTPPDNSRRTTPKTRILRGVAFPTRLSQRWIKLFNPSLWVSDCVNCPSRGLGNLSTAFTLGGKWFERRRFSSSRKTPSSVRPRGTRPVPPVEHDTVKLTSELSKPNDPCHSKTSIQQKKRFCCTKGDWRESLIRKEIRSEFPCDRLVHRISDAVHVRLKPPCDARRGGYDDCRQQQIGQQVSEKDERVLHFLCAGVDHSVNCHMYAHSIIDTTCVSNCLCSWPPERRSKHEPTGRRSPRAILLQREDPGVHAGRGSRALRAINKN